MRPIYETAQDLSNENLFKAKIESAWKIKLHKLPINWRADYIMSNRAGACIGFAEIKCRNILSTKYPTFLISKSKIDYMNQFSKHFGFIKTSDGMTAKRTPILRTKKYSSIPVLIFVRCKDKDLYYKYDEQDYEKGMFIQENGGRIKNTRDPKDIETVIHIPWGLFKEVPHEKTSKS